jgi:YhcH/YjgK/YiaL family protein
MQEIFQRDRIRNPRLPENPMILDHISRASSYEALSPRFKAAFDWLQSAAVDSLPTGRVDIVPGEAYALVQRYATKPRSEGKWEAHRKHIDIQFIHSGRELMLRESIERCQAGEYNPEKDFVAIKAEGGTELSVRQGEFAVFFPHDAHMPGLADRSETDVVKVVVKISCGDGK